jgi:hypothetical protein
MLCESSLIVVFLKMAKEGSKVIFSVIVPMSFPFNNNWCHTVTLTGINLFTYNSERKYQNQDTAKPAVRQ